VLAIFRSPAVGEDVGRAVSHFGRIVEIQRCFIQQIDVLETMTPLDFLDFRDYLIPASGVQSVQFRLVENKLGVRREDRLQLNDAPYTSRFRKGDRARLEASEKEPSLFDLLQSWLERTPFLTFGGFDFWREYRRAVEAMLSADRESIRRNPTLTEKEKSTQLAGLEATALRFEEISGPSAGESKASAPGRHFSRRALQASLLINLYRDEPILHLPFRLLSLVTDVERNFTTWRQRHAQMALRMIGTRIHRGTWQRISRPGGRTSQGLRRPRRPLVVLHSALGASPASGRRSGPDGVQVRPAPAETPVPEIARASGASAMTLSSIEMGVGRATTPTVVRVGRIAPK
jgi:tryptophan 2,3-dioxygenase